MNAQEEKRDTRFGAITSSLASLNRSMHVGHGIAIAGVLTGIPWASKVNSGNSNIAIAMGIFIAIWIGWILRWRWNARNS